MKVTSILAAKKHVFCPSPHDIDKCLKCGKGFYHKVHYRMSELEAIMERVAKQEEQE